MNVIWFPQIPGVPFMVSEGDIHRSGLERAQTTVSSRHETLEKFRVLEFGCVSTPDVLRSVHRVNGYSDFITRVQLHDSPVSQGQYHVLHRDPFGARDGRPEP